MGLHAASQILNKTKDVLESLRYYLRICTTNLRRRCCPEGNLVESIRQFYCLLKKKQMTLARAHNRDTVPLITVFALSNKAKCSRFPDDAKSLQATFSRGGENATRMRSSSEIGKVTSGRVSVSASPVLKAPNNTPWSTVSNAALKSSNTRRVTR